MTDLPSVEHDPGRQRFHVEVEGHQAPLAVCQKGAEVVRPEGLASQLLHLLDVRDHAVLAMKGTGDLAVARRVAPVVRMHVVE